MSKFSKKDLSELYDNVVKPNNAYEKLLHRYMAKTGHSEEKAIEEILECYRFESSLYDCIEEEETTVFTDYAKNNGLEELYKYDTYGFIKEILIDLYRELAEYTNNYIEDEEYTLYLYCNYYGIFEGYNDYNADTINGIKDKLEPYCQKGFYKVIEDITFRSDSKITKGSLVFLTKRKLDEYNYDLLSDYRYSGLSEDEEFFNEVYKIRPCLGV